MKVRVIPFGVQFAKVEFDVDTGFVPVPRITVAHDPGRTINSLLGESQRHGSIVRGLVFALFETRHVNAAIGPSVNASVHSDKIRPVADVPTIDTFRVSGSDMIAQRVHGRRWPSASPWLALGALLVATAACARPPAARSAPAAMHVDTVWYVSTRARDDDGQDTHQLADSLEYGLAIFVRPAAVDVRTGSPDFTLADSVRLTVRDFTAALKRRVQATVAPLDYAVFYVHGFGTSLHEAWTFAATARARAATDAPWIAFCWPSNGAGIAAPTLAEPLSQAYIDDSTAAVASRPAFDRALRTVVAAVSAPRVMLVPHSLGSQLVGETLAQDMPLRTLLGAAPLRAVGFVAPDVEARRFAEYLVPAVRPLTERLLLYTSAHDRVLEFSSTRTQSRRAGRHADAPLTHEGLETVDVTDGVSAGGWLQQTFGNHHAIARATGSLFDLGWVVGGRRRPDCRLAIGSASLGAAGVWRLTDTLPNPRHVAERCSSAATKR